MKSILNKVKQLFQKLLGKEDSIDYKVFNTCKKYRLVSPNYTSVFEFNPLKNLGVTTFNVDFNYRPYNPYIHIAPFFNSEGLYGVDEVLAYGICNLYGSIALTNFGFIDKKKYGIIAKLNEGGKDTGIVNTFIDDIVGAIAASAASRFAHRWVR